VMGLAAVAPAPADARGAAGRKPSAAAAAKQRRALSQAVRHNPRKAFTRGFLRKASLVNFQLPLTARLNPQVGSPPVPASSDDRLEVTSETDVVPWPLDTASYAPPGAQQAALD